MIKGILTSTDKVCAMKGMRVQNEPSEYCLPGGRRQGSRTHWVEASEKREHTQIRRMTHSIGQLNTTSIT